MNREQFPGLGWVAVAGFTLVVAVAFAPILWVRLSLGLAVLGGAAWWTVAATSRLRGMAALLSDLTSRASEGAARWAQAAAAIGMLTGKIGNRAALVSQLGNCAELQRDIPGKIATLLEGIALVQEDLSQLTPGIAVMLDVEGPAAREQAKDMAALAQANEAKVSAVAARMQVLQPGLESLRQESDARRSELLRMAESFLGEIDVGQASLSASETALANWRDPVGEIGQAVQAATDLAEQARILGVNASIEALRSGEAGRGFMLVAEEAERLSDRMLRVVHQIAAQVDESEKTTLAAAGGLTETRAALARLAEAGRWFKKEAATGCGPEPGLPMDELDLLKGTAAQLVQETRSLGDTLAQAFTRLEPGPAKEASEAAARMFGEANEVARMLRGSGTAIDEARRVAQEIEAYLVEVESEGQELARALAAGS